MVLSMFLAYVAIYSERSHLGITLIAMLNSTFVVHHQYQHQQLAADVNLTRRRADCKPFPRRDYDVSRANTTKLRTLTCNFFIQQSTDKNF